MRRRRKVQTVLNSFVPCEWKIKVYRLSWNVRRNLVPKIEIHNRERFVGERAWEIHDNIFNYHERKYGALIIEVEMTRVVLLQFSVTPVTLPRDDVFLNYSGAHYWWLDPRNADSSKSENAGESFWTLGKWLRTFPTATYPNRFYSNVIIFREISKEWKFRS